MSIKIILISSNVKTYKFVKVTCKQSSLEEAERVSSECQSKSSKIYQGQEYYTSCKILTIKCESTFQVKEKMGCDK